MIDLYAAILNKLKEDVPELMFINLDSGEIDEPENNYAILFPAVLISFENIEWQSYKDGLQQGVVNLLVRCAFDVVEDMNNLTPDAIMLIATTKLQLINKIHAKLHDFGGDNFTRLQRYQSETEKRADRLFVYDMRYRCSYIDNSAKQDWTLIKIEGFDVIKKPFPIPEPEPEPEP